MDANETWNEKKNFLKQKLVSLTGNGLLYEESKNDEVVEKLQIKLGKTKDEVNKIIESL